MTTKGTPLAGVLQSPEDPGTVSPIYDHYGTLYRSCTRVSVLYSPFG